MIFYSDFFVFGFTLLFCSYFENALHRASHYKSTGSLYRWHKKHHKEYPPSRLETDVYIDSDSWIDNHYLRYVLVSLSCICAVSSIRVSIIVIPTNLLYGYILSYLHEHYHLKQSWLLKYEWFRYRKQYHLLHHRKQTYNYSFFCDKVDMIQHTFISE